MIHAIWKYRFFILENIVYDFKKNYVQSKIGALWAVFHPLAIVAIYSFVLSSIMHARISDTQVDDKYAYIIYLLAGVSSWWFFNDLLNKLLNIFIVNSSLIKKITFPKICLPVITLGESLINHLILLICILAINILLGNYFTFSIIYLPILILQNSLFGAGLGLILGIINVFIRDVAQIASVVLQMLYWLTPIVYTLDIIPPYYQPYLKLNPMYYIVRGYQSILVYGNPPDLDELIIISLINLVFLFIAYHLFKKSSNEIIDAL